MYLKNSWQYPFQGQGWFRRIFTLALLQLLPIIGQVLLLGYGLEVVRAVNKCQVDLPSLNARRALGDGLRLMAAGLLFLVPILVVAPMILSTGISQAGSDEGGLGSARPFIFAAFVLVAMPGLSRVVKRRPRIRPFITALSGVVMIVFVGLTVRDLLQTPLNLSLNNLSLNTAGVIQLAILALVAIMIYVGLQAVGVRYAIKGTGLLQPTQVLRTMASHRRQTAVLVLNTCLLDVAAIVAVGLGLLLLVIPGLFLFVVVTLVQWHLFARYGAEIGLTVDKL